MNTANYFSKGRLIATTISLEKVGGDSTSFVTQPHHSLQVGVLNRKHGTEIKAHQHTPTKQQVEGCQEVLIIANGNVKAKVYDPENQLVAVLDLKAGTVFIQYLGGHSFEVVEDVQIVEIKQGPYKAEDKFYFNPLEHEQSK